MRFWLTMRLIRAHIYRQRWATPAAVDFLVSVIWSCMNDKSFRASIHCPREKGSVRLYQSLTFLNILKTLHHRPDSSASQNKSMPIRDFIPKHQKTTFPLPILSSLQCVWKYLKVKVNPQNQTEDSQSLPSFSLSFYSSVSNFMFVFMKLTRTVGP